MVTLSARKIVIIAVLGLAAVISSGGALFSFAERVSYLDGVSLAFSVVSTTGFGPGPQTTLGAFVMFGVFAAGAACWFTIIVAAFETGLRRYRSSLNGVGPSAALGDPWARSIVPKGRG